MGAECLSGHFMWIPHIVAPQLETELLWADPLSSSQFLAPVSVGLSLVRGMTGSMSPSTHSDYFRDGDAVQWVQKGLP